MNEKIIPPGTTTARVIQHHNIKYLLGISMLLCYLRDVIGSVGGTEASSTGVIFHPPKNVLSTLHPLPPDSPSL